MYWKIIIFTLLFLPFSVSAHPGDTDSFDCHTCETNCSSWGLDYGEYHCHAKVSCYAPTNDCDVGSQTAIQSRRGLLGSDFGNAQIAECQQVHETFLERQAEYQSCLQKVQSPTSYTPKPSTPDPELDVLLAEIKSIEECHSKGWKYDFKAKTCSCGTGLYFDTTTSKCEIIPRKVVTPVVIEPAIKQPVIAPIVEPIIETINLVSTTVVSATVEPKKEIVKRTIEQKPTKTANKPIHPFVTTTITTTSLESPTVTTPSLTTTTLPSPVLKQPIKPDTYLFHKIIDFIKNLFK